MDSLRDHIDSELAFADQSLESGDSSAAFEYLERAHVLGQAMTFEHTRIHWRMLKLGWKTKDVRRYLVS